jgi:hypothetical protein
MTIFTQQGRALGPVAGTVRGLMRSNSGQDPEAAINRLTACAVVTAGQLGRLNATNQQILSVQNDIALKQQQIVELGHEQVRLQSMMLNVQTAQLAVQRQQLVMQQIAALNLEVQTTLQRKEAVQRDRQRQLKDAAFESKQKVAEISKVPDLVERFALLTQLAASVDAVGLSPNELEEIGDKEYAQSLVDDISRAITVTAAAFSPEDQQDMEFLLANMGARYQWSAASASAGANVATLNAQNAQLNRQIAEVDRALAARTVSNRIDQIPTSKKAMACGVFSLVPVAIFLVAALQSPNSDSQAGVMNLAMLATLLLCGSIVFLATRANARVPLLRRREVLVAQLGQLDHYGHAAAQSATATDSQRTAHAAAIQEFLARRPALDPFL